SRLIPNHLSFLPSEGIRDSRALRGRIGCRGRGDRNSGKDGRAPLRSGTASIEGRLGSPTFRRRNGAWCPNGGGGMLSASHRDYASTRSKVPGAEGGDELEPPVAAAGQEEGSPPDVSRDLRLVHRGIRHGGPEGREVAARRAFDLTNEECAARP